MSRLRDCFASTALAGAVVLVLAASAFAQATQGAGGSMTFDQFKTTRIEQMHRMMAGVDQRLARADLTAEQRQRLTQMKTRLERLQSLSPEQLDQMLRGRFDKIDTAHTGIITPAQIKAFREQERQAHQQARAEGSGAAPSAAAHNGAPTRSLPQSHASGDDFWPAQQ